MFRCEVSFHLKRLPFTLAEVLITLGIIGVVVAMTMPSVVNNVEGKQLQSALKKGYSEVSKDLDIVDFNGLKTYKTYNKKTLSSLI